MGSLELIVTYFHTGGKVRLEDKHGVHAAWWDRCNSFPQLRLHLRNRSANAVRSQHDALTVVGGGLQLDGKRARPAHQDLHEW